MFETGYTSLGSDVLKKCSQSINTKIIAKIIARQQSKSKQAACCLI